MRSERDLIDHARTGDTVAFEALVSMHAPYVYNVALRTLSSPGDAEDITQETFVRVWRSLNSFRGDAQFRTWIYRITTNLCYNRLPRLKRDLEALAIYDDADDEIALPDDQQQVEQDVVLDELRQQLESTINKLPESYRLLISLRHIQGMSYAEIAEATGMPLGTVKTGIFRARRDLRVLLINNGIND